MLVDTEPRIHIGGFYTGAIAVQKKIGVFEKAGTIRSLFVTRPVSEQLQKFFGDLRLVFTATRYSTCPAQSVQCCESSCLDLTIRSPSVSLLNTTVQHSTSSTMYSTNRDSDILVCLSAD